MTDTIIDLAIQSNIISDSLLDAGGELTPELETILETHTKTLATKVDMLALVLDRFEREAQLWKDRKQEADKIKSAYEKAHKRLKELIKSAMTLMDHDKVHGNRYRMTCYDMKSTLVIESEHLDPSYLMAKTVYEPDKDRIRADLEAGKEVRGARLEPCKGLRVIAGTKTV